MANPWKLTNFSKWTKKDFIGHRGDTGWEKALKHNKKISITTPQSSRYWVEGDDSKYYTTDELSKGDVVNVNIDNVAGTASGDVIEASVDSTAIKMISYDPVTKDLEIVFEGGDGKAYIYPNVPVAEVKAFLSSNSKGKYLNYIIKPKYSINQ